MIRLLFLFDEYKYLGPLLQKYIDYRKTSYISRTLIDNKSVDNSDVVGASPFGAVYW